MSRDSIEEKLKNIKRWQFIPGKSRILPVLSSALGKDEYIVDIIDGFFPADSGSKKGKEDSGLILVADKTVLLIRSEYPDRLVSLKKDKIKSISCIKSFSSLTVKIESGRDVYSFVTHLSEFAVKNVFSAAGKPVERDAGPHDVNRPAAVYISPDLQPEENLPAASSTSDLLYPEIKKIRSWMEELKAVITDKKYLEMYRDDIYTVSALCGMNDKKISDNEMLFIYKAVAAGDENSDKEQPDYIGEIMKNDSFPHHIQNEINRKMELIMAGIFRMNNNNDKNLKSLEYIAGYDIENGTNYADKLAALFYEYSQCLLKADGVMGGGDEEKLKTVYALIQKSKNAEAGGAVKAAESDETIDQVMEKINALVGMENIKEEIKSFINFVSIRSERDKRKLPVTPLSLHAVFYGPPGTGKTTIARLLGRVYKALGLLSGGHLVETDRAGLVAGYVGQTAIKTDEMVTKAKDGVLFIDEAYTLAPENSSNDFGRESIDTILKRMEDMREGFAVIAAGYTDEMERFINSNPGLKSRFSRYFYFNHYTPDELVKIFNIFADNVEFKLSDEAADKLKNLITHFYNQRSKSFGNARFVRNVFDKIVQNQADRLAGVSDLTNELLCEVAAEDIPVIEDFLAEQFA